MARLSIEANVAASIEEQSAAREERYSEMDDGMKAQEGDPGPSNGAKDILLLWMTAQRFRDVFELKEKGA